jgi:hypothetical protein
MKKHLILSLAIISFFSLSIQLLAQGKANVDTLEISILGQKNSALKQLEVRNGSPVIIKFSGLNPLRYNYALNHKFVNLFSETTSTPTDFHSSPTGADKSGTPNLSQTIAELNTEIKNLENKKVLQNQNVKNLSGNKKNVAIFKEDSLGNEIQKRIDVRDSLENIKNENLVFFKEFFNRYPDEKSKLGIVFNDSENSDLLNARNGYNIILENSKSIKDQMELELLFAKSQDLLDLDALKKSIQELFTLNAKNSKSFNDIFDKFPFPDDVKTHELRKSILANFEEIQKKFTIVSTLQVTIQTSPIDYHGENIDFIKVSLETIPTDAKAYPIIRIQNYDYKVWIKGGLKIDFSAGIFLSSLRDRTFLPIKQESTENEEDNLYKIIKEDRGRYEFGIGSTVNFTARSSRSVNLGGNVGGYVTANQKFRLVAGPTIVLGKMQRIIFSVGLVMGDVTSLSNRVNLTDSFDLGSDGTVPTVQKFDFGHYFSFTYNLGKAKSKED